MKISLNQQIVGGAILGVAVGLCAASWDKSSAVYVWVMYLSDLAGGLFVSLLKMILIPLVFSSITVGIANLRAHRQMTQVWTTTLVYFAFTTLLAATLGLLVINCFKPGVGLSTVPFAVAMSEFKPTQMSLPQFLLAFLTGLFQNPFAALAKGDVMAAVVFAFFLGIALVKLGERTRTIIAALNEFFEACMLMIDWIMRVAPFGIMGLLVKLVATQNTALLAALGKFVAVVLGSTLFHGFVVLPFLLYALTRRNPLFFFRGFKEALLTALTTSSSNATLPVSLRCARENLGISKEIAGFVFPLGATVNMDGTALYEAAAALFIANIAGIKLDLLQQVIVVLMALLASVGAPGIPSAGMVTMVLVLQSVGLPVEAIAILLPIDRFLDTFRTMVNVEGDGIAALIIQHRVHK